MSSPSLAESFLSSDGSLLVAVWALPLFSVECILGSRGTLRFGGAALFVGVVAVWIFETQNVKIVNC